jgi:general L-amino acid transport system permease protein
MVNDPRARGLAYQAALVVALVALVAFAARNAVVNMEARGVPLGFAFWNETAGFDINVSPIASSRILTHSENGMTR